MQRSTSPDITEGPPPEQKRPGRPRKSITVPTDANITSSPAQTEGPSAKPDSTENSLAQTKRGRGRPKKSQETATASPVPQYSPPISVMTNSTVGGAQQPKRRGRKPKTAQENVESMDTDRPELTSDEMAMDTTSPNPPSSPAQVKKASGASESSCRGMDSEEGNQGVSVSSFFSSVLKSEQPFGQSGGSSGIPGLDLDDCDANISAPSSDQMAPTPVFNFSCGTNSGVEEECKSLQQLSLKNEDVSKPVVNSENVKKEKEDTSQEGTYSENENSKVRRSSRIKTLEEQRGSRGRRREVVSSLSDSSGISRSSLSLHDDDSNSNSSTSMQCSGTSGYSSPNGDGSGNGLTSSASAPNLSALASGGNGSGGKPLKVKSRWRYSLDAESVKSSSTGGESGQDVVTSVADSFIPPDNLVKRKGHLAFDGTDEELLEKLRKFDGIDESIYRTERKISKENRGMVCDCYLSNEDLMRGELGCSEDCLNRLLMVECGNRCPTGESCSNRRFQKKEYAALEVFKTEKKGHGLRTLQHIPEGGFVIEYVGEVLDVPEFERRTNEYAKGNQEHFYFMALKSDAIIDATLRGNCSRFINHSCEPNCETQKWTVNGEVRIGFFAITDLQPGDEITFDYQFQRYGKKAQKCFCMTESCRGWIGDEDDEAAEEIEDKEEEVTREVETEEIEDSKLKPKVKVEKKKRKNVHLEDMAFREELAKLEASGLKNRNHTLTLSRLMVRAESWDDRERLLKILINGETPCRRLFLDYHGLRLIWSWMIDLPLPHESEGPQLIRNDVYHMLFLRALQSLPIPNKTLLLDSKVLALVDKWSSVPQVTTSITLVKRNDAAPTESKKFDTEMSNAAEPAKTQSQGKDLMDVDVKEEPTSTAEGMQEVVEEKNWNFVPLSKSLLESWSDLKEVFRIPKKERVEQMKEHEREADKGQLSSSIQNSSGLSSSSYDRDHRNKQYRRGERRVPVLDSTQPQFHRYPSRMIPPGVTKEQWRKHFEQSVREREEQEMLRRQQDALVNLHQERCALVGLDPATTPIVDPHGVHYLDPKTVMWKPINIDDPTMPPELIKFVQLSQYPPQSETTDVVGTTAAAPVEPEQAFPPWPPGLPPPPPLPPRELPKNWKMAVDDEGRCYYYHVRTRITRWDPPTLEEASSSDSSESTSVEEEEEEEEEIEQVPNEGSPSISKKASIQTWRTKILERAQRRKKSGLVEERIISPRADDEKGFSKEMIKENKKKALEEKMARLAMKDTHTSPDKDANTSGSQTEDSPKSMAVSTEATKKIKEGKGDPALKKSLLKKKRKDRPNVPKGSSSSKPKSKVPVVKQEEIAESSSPIETELDLTLSQQSMEEENDGFFSRVSAGPSRIIGSTPSMEVVMIPGLGFDGRDVDAKKKSADRAARHAAKKKALAMQKKAKEKAPAETATANPSSSSSEKRVSSKEASTIKDNFRNSIATVVVAHLNPYRKSEHIKSTDDFKHLARKITHAILLKELKHTRDVTSLEVTDSVKHKTKEYIKKFMARFPNGVYVRSPEPQQTK